MLTIERNNVAKKCCTRALDLFYDLLACVLSLTDVVSDFLVMLTFYRDGHMSFFWPSVAIFVIAQIAYTILFIVLYCGSSDDRHTFLTFMVVLPIGQFVPAIIWLQSYRWKWLDDFFKACGLKTDIDVGGSHGDIDPLHQYILEKVRTHGGFFVEALVESVPQSILQMIAIVMFEEAEPITVFSITISMISVASKGLVVSYSIDRKTFIFNLLSFVADVFNIFCTVSWLFFIPPSILSGVSQEQRYSIFFLPDNSLSIWTLIWMWKEVVLICAALIWGIWITILFLMEEYDNPRDSHHRYRDYCLIVMLWFFLCALFVPFMVVVESFKLVVFPLIVLKSLDSSHSNNASFFKTLFHFLRSGDFEVKVRVVNRFMASKRVQTNKGRFEKNVCDARIILELSDAELTPKAVREISGYTMRGGLFAYSSIIAEEARNSGGHLSPAQKGWIGLLTYLFYFVVPYLCLNGLYSVVYPIISYFTTSAEDMGMLQEILSLVYMLTLCIMLILARSVYSFKKCVIHTMTFGFRSNISTNWIHEIIAEYSNHLATVFRDESLCRTFPEDIGREIIKFCPETHVVVPRWSRVYVTSSNADTNDADLRYHQMSLVMSRYGPNSKQIHSADVCQDCNRQFDFCQCVLTDFCNDIDHSLFKDI